MTELPDDRQILEQYARTHSPELLGHLVTRYLDFVYTTALREMRDAHLAEDVTQAVFLILWQKAHTLGRTILPAWLFLTTRYAAANVRRMLARRRYHERHAARPEIHMNANHTETAEHLSELNDAIAHLNAREREVLLMRYMQGRTVRQISQVMGTSDDATRKRQERALAKVRRFLLSRGVTAGALVIPQGLFASLSQAAPMGLRAAVSGTAGPSTSSMAIAKGALKMILWNKLLAAGASVAAMLALVAGTVGIIKMTQTHLDSPHRRSMATVLPVSAVSPIDDENTVPGEPCVAISDIVLDTQGASALLKLSTPVPSQGTFYELHQAKASDVRSFVADVQANQQFLAIGPKLSHSSPFPPLKLGSIPTEQRHIILNNAANMYAMLDFPFVFFKTENDPQGAKMKIDFENQLQRLGIVGVSQRLEKPATLHWTGTIAPGNMLLMFGDFGEYEGEHFVCVRLVEVYKATEFEQRFISQNTNLTGKQWLATGPVGARDSVDRFIVWTGKSADPQPTADKWIKRLSDGTTVELTSVARPEEFPFCCWDAGGRALPFIGDEGAAGLTRNSGIGVFRGPGDMCTITHNQMPGQEPAPAAIGVSLYIHSPLPRVEQWSEIYRGDTEKVIPDDPDSVTAYVGVGNWQEQALADGGTATVGNATISVNARPDNGGPTTRAVNGRVVKVLPPGYAFTATGQFDLDTEIALGVVTKDHVLKVVGMPGRVITEAQLRNRSVDNLAQARVAPQDVDHFVVMSRRRERVTFQGFANGPLPEVPEAVTHEEVVTANAALIQDEQKQRDVTWARQWKERLADLAVMDAIPRDPATPAGAMRIMTDRALAGDEAGVRACMFGSDDHIKTLAAELTAQGQALAMCEKKFGAETLQRQTSAAGFYHMIWTLPGETYLINAWTVHGDFAYSQISDQSLALHDGKWQLNADPPFEDSPILQRQSEMHAKDWAKIIEGLQSGKITTAAEAVAY